MAPDSIFCILVYLCIFQNSNAIVSPRGGSKKEIPSNECQNCERRVRREINEILNEIKSKYTKSLAEKFQEYKNSRKSNWMLTGWGARGMPFNVLYTPNIQQQKMMKHIPQNQKLLKEVRNTPIAYNLVVEKPRNGKANAMNKNLVPRKYYSHIPQFFVSYDWHRKANYREEWKKLGEAFAG